MTWPTVPLKRVCRLQSGLTIDGDRRVSGDTVTRPYLRVSNVQAGWLDLSSVSEVTVTSRMAASSTLRPGHVLMTEGGDLDKLGRGTVWRGEIANCLHQNHIFALRPEEGVLEPRFLAYVTQGMPSRHYFESTGTKTTNLASTNSSKILNMPTPLPPFEEQRRIADFLDTESSRVDSLSLLRTQTLQLLFERQESRIDGLVRGTSHCDKITAEYPTLGEVPANWAQGRLRNIDCSVQTGPFGSQLHAADYVDGGWPVVNPANITSQGLVADRRSTVGEDVRTRLGAHILQRGDVVFGRRGELGRAGVVSATEEGWVCGTGSLRVRFRSDSFDSEYLRRFLAISAVRHYFALNAIGTTMANLNTSILLNMPLLIPCLEEQREIARLCTMAEDDARVVRRRIARQVTLLAERKQALITAAVTGQLDVTTARRVEVS